LIDTWPLTQASGTLAMGVLECFWAGETARDRRKTDTGIFSLGQSRPNERERASGAYMLCGQFPLYLSISGNTSLQPVAKTKVLTHHF
jgi:hypothetical protein